MTIAEIAAATKANCHPEGIGHVINVFSDGTYMIGASENDIIARGDGNNGWDYRICCLRYPMTRKEVAEVLANA
jgi:hypothetical protein